MNAAMVNSSALAQLKVDLQLAGRVAPISAPHFNFGSNTSAPIESEDRSCALSRCWCALSDY